MYVQFLLYIITHLYYGSHTHQKNNGYSKCLSVLTVHVKPPCSIFFFHNWENRAWWLENRALIDSAVNETSIITFIKLCHNSLLWLFLNFVLSKESHWEYYFLIP